MRKHWTEKMSKARNKWEDLRKYEQERSKNILSCLPLDWTVSSPKISWLSKTREHKTCLASSSLLFFTDNGKHLPCNERDAAPRNTLLVIWISLCISPPIYCIYYTTHKCICSTFTIRPFINTNLRMSGLFLLFSFKSDSLMSVFPPPTSPGVFIDTEQMIN